MSNKELCIRLINEIDDSSLANVVTMLQSIKNIIDDSLDDRYCLGLYEAHLADTAPDKEASISLTDYAKELGIAL